MKRRRRSHKKRNRQRLRHLFLRRASPAKHRRASKRLDARLTRATAEAITARGAGSGPRLKSDCVQRAAATISKAIDRMVSDLPEYAAPDMATVRLVRELTGLRPTWMQQIMDGRWT